MLLLKRRQLCHPNGASCSHFSEWRHGRPTLSVATLLPGLRERRQVRSLRSSSPHFADGGPWKASERHENAKKRLLSSSGELQGTETQHYGTVVRCSGGGRRGP